MPNTSKHRVETISESELPPGMAVLPANWRQVLIVTINAKTSRHCKRRYAKSKHPDWDVKYDIIYDGVEHGYLTAVNDFDHWVVNFYHPDAPSSLMVYKEFVDFPEAKQAILRAYRRQEQNELADSKGRPWVDLGGNK